MDGRDKTRQEKEGVVFVCLLFLSSLSENSMDRFNKGTSISFYKLWNKEV